MSKVSGEERVEMAWATGLRQMEPGASEGIKARAQEEGKVEGMRKEISSSETEMDCGRVR